MSVVDLQQMENNPPSPSEEKSLHYQKTNRLVSLLKKRDRTSDPTELFDSGTDEEDCYLPNTLRIASPKRHSSSSAIMQKKPLTQEQTLNDIVTAAGAGTKAAPVAVTETTRTAQSSPRNVTHSPSSSLSSSPKQTKAGSNKKKSVSMKVYNQSPKRVSSSVTAHTTQQQQQQQAFQEEEAIVETASETSSSEGEQEEEDFFVDARGTQETTNTSVPLHIEAPKNRNQGLSLDSSSNSLPPSRQGSRRPPLASKENKMEIEMENTGIPEPVSPPKVKRGILRASSSTSSASSISSEPLQSPLSKPKPLKRQSSLLSPRSQRNRHSNRVSFADKDGGEISSHVTIDVSPNRLSRRVKRAGDRSSPPGSPDRSAGGKTSRVLVLLMDPIKKQYELTSISYAPTVPARKGSSGQGESTPIRTLLDLIPAAVSHKPLKKQVYTGFCRPNVGKEMVNLLTVEDYAIRDDEVLIAIPENFKGSDCIVLAKPILADPRLVRLLKKLKRNGKKKKQLRPPSSAVSNDQLKSTIGKDKAIEKVDQADINITSWRTIAKLLSFLLVLLIFVKMAVDEEMKNRIPSVLSFELNQFNQEQFHQDSTSLAVGGWKSGENIAKNQTHSEPKNVFLAGIKEFVMSIDGDFI